MSLLGPHSVVITTHESYAKQVLDKNHTGFESVQHFFFSLGQGRNAAIFGYFNQYFLP